MNMIIRFISLVLIAAGLAGCSVSPMTGYPGYGATADPLPERQRFKVETRSQRYYAAIQRPDGKWEVNLSNPLPGPVALPAGAELAYLGQGDRWYIKDGPWPRGTVVVTGVPSVQRPGFPTGIGAPFPWMSASLATTILADVDKGRNPCESASWKDMTAFGFFTGLATLALTGDPGIGIGVGLFSALGVSGNSQWNCALHNRLRWSLLATIDAGKPRCLETLNQVQTNGQLQETLTRQCAAVEEGTFKRIGQATAPTPAASAPVTPTPRQAPVRLRDAKPEKPPK